MLYLYIYCRSQIPPLRSYRARTCSRPASNITIRTHHIDVTSDGLTSNTTRILNVSELIHAQQHHTICAIKWLLMHTVKVMPPSLIGIPSPPTYITLTLSDIGVGSLMPYHQRIAQRHTSLLPCHHSLPQSGKTDTPLIHYYLSRIGSHLITIFSTRIFGSGISVHAVSLIV